MSKVSIIIVTWNSRDYLRACLDALTENERGDQAEVFVVDNASSDGSAELVRASYPHVSLKEADVNLGFAAANNLAIGACSSEYLLLLNPDTVVHPGAIHALVEFMEAHPGAWAAGPMLLNADGSLQRTGVRFPSVWNMAVEALFLDRAFPKSRIFGRHRELYCYPLLARKVDFVQGSCLMVRREPVLERVGLLDDGYFMYFEETDWCFRMKKENGEVWLCPSARVVHFGGGEQGHYDAQRVYYFHESLFRFAGKHFSLAKRVMTRIIIFVRSILRVLAWAILLLFNPRLRRKAISPLKGYGRVLLLCFRSHTRIGLPRTKGTL